MALVAVAPDRYARGFQPGQEDAPEVYVVTELCAALERVYRTNAHLTAYVVEGTLRHARVNKPGLPHVERRLLVGAFFCDVDNAGHAAWTEDAFAAARMQDATLPSLRTAGIYYTRHGRRIVQPLAEPLVVDDRVEAFLARWLRQLESEGLTVDWKCVDWTRHFQLPHVPRQPGGRSRLVDLERMVPIDVEPLDAGIALAKPQEAARAPRTARAPIAWTMTLPSIWHAAVERIARAIAEVATEWHTLFLALAGALLRRGFPAEHVPAFCEAVSLATGRDTRTANRVRAAKTTVERFRQGRPTIGYERLCDDWPAVADALDLVVTRNEEERLREHVERAPNAPSPSITELMAMLENAIRDAPPGLTLIAAGCGLGKTRAAERVAVERAGKAPLERTSLAVDKHELARQVVRDLGALGVEVGRHFSPAKLAGANGAPVCRYHRIALPLVAGGQSMHWELCRGRDRHPCEHYATCPAKDGYEGAANPIVHVGPHPLLPRLDRLTGVTGLLVIDEPPSPLETLTFSIRDIDRTLAMLDGFNAAYSASMRPLLEAVRAWIVAGEGVGEATTIAAAVERYERFVDHDVLAEAQDASGSNGGAVACAIAAPAPEGIRPVPPLRPEQLSLLRQSEAHARHIGRASSVLRALRDALTSKTPVAARLERRGSQHRLHLTRVIDSFARTLRRSGATVVLDANADLWAPVYAKILGREPRVLRFDASDGAPIERTLLRLTSATRSAWQPHGRLTFAPSLRTAITGAIEWALERPGNGVLAIVTTMLVRFALEAALAPDDATYEERWRRRRQDPAVLAAVRAELGPIFRRWPGRILFGHYGALRGLDAMAGADALATIGDPWVNLGDVRSDCAFLGLSDWEARYEAMCRAELEQAHGRLRTVHRTRPGRALHVGAVVPGGRGWGGGHFEVRRVAPGPAKRRAEEGDAVELEALCKVLGSISAVAHHLGCDRKTVRRYLAGERTLPPDLRKRVRAMGPRRCSEERCGAP